MLAQMKPSSTIAAHAKQPAQPPAPLPSTATLPAILATPSIMSLVEVRPPSPSAIVQPGRSLNPWDPEDVNYVRPTIEELDERVCE